MRRPQGLTGAARRSADRTSPKLPLPDDAARAGGSGGPGLRTSDDRHVPAAGTRHAGRADGHRGSRGFGASAWSARCRWPATPSPTACCTAARPACSPRRSARSAPPCTRARTGPRSASRSARRTTAPPRQGTVTGVATRVHGGRTLATYEVVITGEDGRRVCTSRLTCLFRDTVPGVLAGCGRPLPPASGDSLSPLRPMPAVATVDPKSPGGWVENVPTGEGRHGTKGRPGLVSARSHRSVPSDLAGRVSRPPGPQAGRRPRPRPPPRPGPAPPARPRAC